jgi:hypothetical protein
MGLSDFSAMYLLCVHTGHCFPFDPAVVNADKPTQTGSLPRN